MFRGEREKGLVKQALTLNFQVTRSHRTGTGLWRKSDSTGAECDTEEIML